MDIFFEAEQPKTEREALNGMESLNQLYRIGRGPSSSHTMGPALASEKFLNKNKDADKFRCVEVESITVSVNDNDVLINLYGDEDNYKCFPDIGETIKDKIICATRRINNEQIFYDFKETNLRKINFGEDVLCIEHGYGGKIIDIRVYSNKTLEEMELNEYHEQVNKYFKNEQRYYQEMIEATQVEKEMQEKLNEVLDK